MHYLLQSMIIPTLRCLVAVLTWTHTSPTPKIAGSIQSSVASEMSSPLPSYHHHHGHQDHCARIHLRVDWLRDLSSSTLTVSAQSEHGRDRRCIFTKPHQKECILDNIDVGVNNDGKLHIHCRLHNAPTYNIGTENNQAAKHLPDVPSRITLLLMPVNWWLKQV